MSLGKEFPNWKLCFETFTFESFCIKESLESAFKPKEAAKAFDG